MRTHQLLSAVVAIGLAVAAPAGARETAPAALKLLSLTYATDVQGDRVLLKADAPIASYKPYQYSLGQSSRLVLDIPFAASELRSSYAVNGSLVKTVRVSPAVEEGVERIRVLFELSREVDYAIEVKGGELGISFRQRGEDQGGRAPVASVASTDRPTLDRASLHEGKRQAAPEDYRIGIGDTLKVSVFDHPDLSGSYKVEFGGVILFPLAGRIQASGTTVLEFQAALRSVLERDYLVNPQVAVTVESYHSQAVDVTGSVRNPGRHFLQGETRLQDILSMAGGPAAEAGEEIVVSRGEQGESRVIRVSRSELYSGTRPELNVLLEAGDVVEVKGREGISVMGEVARPGSYEWKPSLTLLQAIALAGGPTVWARDSAEILRGQVRIEVNLGSIKSGKKKDVELKPGDYVSVRRRIL